MAMTPHENTRENFSAGPSHHVFRVQSNNTNATSQYRNFGRPGMGVLRLQSQQVSYTGPYTSTPSSRSNINNASSAEQQIAQGILSNSSIPNSPNTPRRPSSLNTPIHVSSNSAPQAQPMSVSHAINPSSAINQVHRPRQSQNSSPILQHQNIQRQSINSSPVNGVRSRSKDEKDEASQDLSMIDPQLDIDQQLTPRNPLVCQAPFTESPSIVQGEMLSPPPGGSFPTFEALFSFAQAHALAHGYAFVIGRSKRDNRGLKKVFLICDRGGTNKEKVHGEQRQRKTKSRKCGCEFGVFGLENRTAWLLRGRIDGEHLMHNHPPSESPTEHPGARKLDPKAIAAVKALEENGT